jgi:hypothetical protein
MMGNAVTENDAGQTMGTKRTLMNGTGVNIMVNIVRRKS